jgi:hypothetical protein
LKDFEIGKRIREFGQPLFESGQRLCRYDDKNSAIGRHQSLTDQSPEESGRSIP